MGAAVTLPAMIAAPISTYLVTVGNTDAIDLVSAACLAAVAGLLTGAVMGATFARAGRMRNSPGMPYSFVVGVALCAVLLGAYLVASAFAVVSLTTGLGLAINSPWQVPVFVITYGTTGLAYLGIPSLVLVIPQAYVWVWCMRRGRPIQRVTKSRLSAS